MKINKLLLAFVGMSMTFSVAMATTNLKDARIYINPGHGGWTANDRPMATINHVQMDTTGFFETNTNLRKGLDTYYNLKDAGVAFIKLSRNSNGWVSSDDSHPTDNDKVTDETVQIIKLSAISADVEANNIDYFLSIHSNAATEGNSTNYPLILYRGTDDAVGNGLVEAKNMGIAAWPYINSNEVSFKSFYQNPGDVNVRGDMTFMGGSTTTMGYTGYYGVLRHGADGFLSEGCFHTYHPERHRLLNVDYTMQEGERYARAIRAWFGDKGKVTGDIMGSVKDKSKSLEHNLYKYKANSIDSYYPLNEVSVVLKDATGKELGKYTTDKEYNGIFVFKDLKPGKYTLDYTGITGFWPFTEEIEVVANETAFTNARITPTTEPEPTEDVEVAEVGYYKHPKQDGDIATGSSYVMAKSGTDVTIEVLKDLTVRRSILRDGKLYVLAVNADKAPKLVVINPTDGSLIKEMSTTGIVTEGYKGKKYPYVLSDIAFTNDGVLIGANSTVIGKPNNSYQTGDFYMYSWKAEGTTALEDAIPTILHQLPTNVVESLAPAGNNNSNLMSNSIAIDGDFNNFTFFFDSHAGNGWNTDYGMRYCNWTIKDGKVTNTQWNDANPAYNESLFGEDARITLSPLAINRVMVDGSKIPAKEMEIDMLGTLTKDLPDLKDEKVTLESYGSNYIRYAESVLMTAPICKLNGGKYDYSINLYDITGGLDKAKLLNESEVLCTKDAIVPMWANAVVDNADISEYLMVGNQVFTYTTKGQTQSVSPARIFAYNLKQEVSGENYTITFTLNETPTSATVVLTDVSTGSEVLRTPVSSPVKGVNSVVINKADFAGENVICNWGIEATAANVTRFTKLSNDDNQFKFYAPFGVSIDKSTESDYFGRIYVTNTLSGEASGRKTDVGIYALGSDFSDITSQKDVAHNGGISWTGVAGEGPRKLTVAADGRIFICDQSIKNSGIYYMNPKDFSATSIFTGATRDAAGKLTIGGTYVGGVINSLGIRGTGANTQLYAVDATASGAPWKKFVNIYNIGDATTWTVAPNYSKANSSYIGNANNSIQPVSTGFWAGQFRGETSNSSANPCLFFYSDSHGDAVWDSATPSIITGGSLNGAMAVKENEKLIALSTNGGVSVYSYKLDKKNIPTVTEKFSTTLEGQGDYSNDFEFDYAGNLYAVSNVGERLGVWSIPTTHNSCLTPAKKSMVISVGTSGVEDVEDNADGKIIITPNPANDVVKVISPKAINRVNIFAVSSGAMVNMIENVGANEVTIDVSNLASGVYLVKVDDASAVKMIKK
ncbi:MAG: T9SS type A sorting domain-containing protein [Muribaculaceae bacterium]